MNRLVRGATEEVAGCCGMFTDASINFSLGTSLVSVVRIKVITVTTIVSVKE